MCARCISSLYLVAVPVSLDFWASLCNKISTRGYVMAAYIQTFSHNGSLQPEVKLLSRLVDEQRWDSVHLQKMRSGQDIFKKML